MLKNKVYINRIAVDYHALYLKVQDYFHRHGVEIAFDFQTIDVKKLSYIIRQFPQGQRIILQPTMANIVVINPTYDFTSFVFNQAEFTLPNLPTDYTYCPIKQPFMDIGTHQLNPPNLDYVNICHEMMHALTIKANQAGFVTQDQMDSYYKPMNLEDADSNFGRQWVLLQPYIHSLKPPVSPVPATNPDVTITRLHDDGKQITGQLRTSDGKFGCDTSELSYKNNQHNISAIPKGVYKCVWAYMTTLKESHYQLQAVLGRSGIFIHEGNFATGKKIDIEGCILLGGAYSDIDGNGEPDIINSRAILTAFEAKMAKQPFTLTIK